MSKIEEALKTIYNHDNRYRLLSDPDYFLQSLARLYSPDMKEDCKLLEKAFRAGAGTVLLHMTGPDTEQTINGQEQIKSFLRNKAGLSQAESERVIYLLFSMVGADKKQTGPNTLILESDTVNKKRAQENKKRSKVIIIIPILIVLFVSIYYFAEQAKNRSCIDSALDYSNTSVMPNVETNENNQRISEQTDVIFTVHDEMELYNTIKEYAKKRVGIYTLVRDDLYTLEQMRKDLYSIIPSLGIRQYKYDTTKDNKIVFEVKYPDSFSICETANDILDYIEECAKKREKEIAIYLSREYARKCKEDNHYELDYTLAISKLKYPGEFLYSEEENSVVFYEDIEYVETVNIEERVANSLEDLMKIYERRSNELSGRFCVFVSDEVLSLIQSKNTYSESGRLWNEIMYNNGMFASFGYIHEHWIKHSGIIYYPGKRIAHAYRNGKVSTLTEIEQRTLHVALDLIGGIYGSDLERVKRIHDVLCKQIKYSHDKTSRPNQSLSLNDRDTAVGALVYGMADCDGFADAFYLCCNIAGIDARHQRGVSNYTSERHAWNIVCIDGKWRMVDVTWDMSVKGRVSHEYFNMGAQKASKSHVWDKRALLYDIDE